MQSSDSTIEGELGPAGDTWELERGFWTMDT